MPTAQERKGVFIRMNPALKKRLDKYTKKLPAGPDGKKVSVNSAVCHLLSSALDEVEKKT